MSIEWQDVWSALALMLVFEGIMPFMFPARWRVMMLTAAQQPNSALRFMGVSSMLIGLLILYFVR